MADNDFRVAPFCVFASQAEGHGAVAMSAKSVLKLTHYVSRQSETGKYPNYDFGVDQIGSVTP